MHQSFGSNHTGGLLVQFKRTKIGWEEQDWFSSDSKESYGRFNDV